MVMSTPREAARVVTIGGKRFKLASDADAKRAGERRAWDGQFVPRQNVDSRPEFEISLGSFHQGFGFTYAVEPGVYDYADGWDALAPGQISTWGEFTRCEPFETVNIRGYEIDFGGYLYVLRGNYAVKYRPVETQNEWPIIERHYFGANARVSGPPAIYGGYMYVPLQGLTSSSLERWHRLTTVSNTTTEVQTVTETGSPTGGTFLLTFDDGLTSTATSALAYNATAAQVQAALRLIPGLEKVTVTRSGTTTNFVWTITMTGAPCALGTTSPPALVRTDNTTGGSHAIAVATTTAGVGDRWDRGPNTYEASRFVTFDGKLTRSNAYQVSSASADPLTGANWGTLYDVGDPSRNITALGVFERFLVPVKPDGVYTFDSSAQDIPEPLGIEGVIDEDAGIGLAVAHAFMYIPHRTGLIRWRPGGPYAYIGPEQDGRFEGALTLGWGRVRGIGQYGKTLYMVTRDTYNSKSGLISMTPTGGDRGPYTPHIHHLFDEVLDDVKVVSVTSEPVVTHYPSTIVNDSTVGTVDWTNPSNIGSEDDVRATFGGAAATSHYLNATGFNFNIPTDAIIDGILAIVSRKATGGATTETFSYTGGTQNFVVPAGITSITVDAQGAQGGAAYAGPSVGGKGARVQTIIPVTPGETLVVRVGGAGAAGSAGGAGGYNGGGNGGNGATTADGAGGGGASDIRRSSTKLVVAGGGGGAGYYAGGQGGKEGANGVGLTIATGATQSAGGTGGAGRFGGSAGSSGSSGTGGAGGASNGADPTFDGGGGGGGGYYGGGGGGGSQGNTDSGGGGGGSSYSSGDAADTSYTAGYKTGNGVVTITYETTSEVNDNSVKLVKGGAISGAERAFALDWGTDEALFAYGSPTDLHGLTLNPSDVNASTFGIAFSVTVTGSDVEAQVDSIGLQVYYHRPGNAEPSPFIAVLMGDDTTTTPVIYKIPRSGFTVANDPFVNRAVAGSALKVYARVDDGDEFQLELAGGGDEIAETGFHELFFPDDSRSVGGYCQLRFVVGDAEFLTSRLYHPSRNVQKAFERFECWVEAEPETLTSGAAALAVKVRDGMLRGVYQPLRSEIVHAVFVLDDEQTYEGAGNTNRSAAEQKKDLESFSKTGSHPQVMQDIFGNKARVHIPLPHFRELEYIPGEPSRLAAIVDIRKLP